MKKICRHDIGTRDRVFLLTKERHRELDSQNVACLRRKRELPSEIFAELLHHQQVLANKLARFRLHWHTNAARNNRDASFPASPRRFQTGLRPPSIGVVSRIAG